MTLVIYFLVNRFFPTDGDLISEPAFEPKPEEKSTLQPANTRPVVCLDGCRKRF